MRIALFGAGGTLGSRILAEALDRGHEVVAVVRDPQRRPPGDVPFVVGDATDPASVAAAVRGCDAVISAVGGAKAGNARAVVDAARALVEGLPEAGVRRLLIVGGAGGLQVAAGTRLVDAPEFPAAWRPASLAQCDALAVYQESAQGLDWTYVAPADVIEPGERTGRYATDTDRLVVDAQGESFISAEDYAVALIDELERPRHVGGRLAVGPAEVRAP